MPFLVIMADSDTGRRRHRARLQSHVVVWQGVLPAHSVCVMEGADLQSMYEHCVPPRARVPGTRISVTARYHVPARHADA